LLKYLKTILNTFSPNNEIIFSPMILLFFLLFIFIVKNIITIIVYYKESKFVNDLREGLSKKILLNYLSLPYAYYFNAKSSEIIKNITLEVDHFTISVFCILRIFLDTTILVGILIYLLFLNFEITASILILFLIFSVIFYFFNRKALVRYGNKRPLLISKRLKLIQEIFRNIKMMKLREKNNLIDEFKFSNSEIAKNAFKTTFLNTIPKPIFELFVIIVFCLFAYNFFSTEKIAINLLPQIGIYVAAIYKIMPSMVKIITGVQTLEYNVQGIDSIYYNILKGEGVKEKSFKKNKLKIKDILNFKNEIKIENLSFKFHTKKSDYVLNNINLSIPKNSHVGIIGKTGEGKSTLTDLIMGLLDPLEGKILVDDFNIQKNISKWQEMIGYVPQETYLHDSSLRENIAFGVDKNFIDDSKVEKVSKLASLSNFIKTLENGFETEVGENGIKLSGGQKQRISIARALYKDPELIIFDEATSSLDATTEKEIINSINSLKNEKTLISISHKLSTMLYCDQIYEIKKGTLIKKNV
ncbi:ABC transporter ATP-binding protein/permease, partial [Pelagibacteraceae bacterium]|nr:ABC transporter ATP-binding protein/permease [Pelagibacteraceae bacterium]